MTISDKNSPNKLNRVYPNGEVEKCSFEEGKAKEVVHFNTNKQVTFSENYQWENNRI